MLIIGSTKLNSVYSKFFGSIQKLKVGRGTRSADTNRFSVRNPREIPSISGTKMHQWRTTLDSPMRISTAAWQSPFDLRSEACFSPSNSWRPKACEEFGIYHLWYVDFTITTLSDIFFRFGSGFHSRPQYHFWLESRLSSNYLSNHVLKF